jgi:hypothetical protein
MGKPGYYKQAYDAMLFSKATHPYKVRKRLFC